MVVRNGCLEFLSLCYQPLWILVPTTFFTFIKDVSRLAIKSRKAKMAIQKPVKNNVLVPAAYVVKIHVPMGIREKSRVSPKNNDLYFLLPSFNKVRKSKSKVKI